MDLLIWSKFKLLVAHLTIWRVSRKVLELTLLKILKRLFHRRFDFCLCEKFAIFIKAFLKVSKTLKVENIYGTCSMSRAGKICKVSKVSKKVVYRVSLEKITKYNHSRIFSKHRPRRARLSSYKNWEPHFESVKKIWRSCTRGGSSGLKQLLKQVLKIVTRASAF